MEVEQKRKVIADLTAKRREADDLERRRSRVLRLQWQELRRRQLDHSHHLVERNRQSRLEYRARLVGWTHWGEGRVDTGEGGGWTLGRVEGGHTGEGGGWTHWGGWRVDTGEGGHTGEGGGWTLGRVEGGHWGGWRVDTLGRVENGHWGGWRVDTGEGGGWRVDTGEGGGWRVDTLGRVEGGEWTHWGGWRVDTGEGGGWTLGRVEGGHWGGWRVDKSTDSLGLRWDVCCMWLPFLALSIMYPSTHHHHTMQEQQKREFEIQYQLKKPVEDLVLKGMPSLPPLPLLPTLQLSPTAFAQTQVVFEFMAAFSEFLKCGE